MAPSFTRLLSLLLVCSLPAARGFACVSALRSIADVTVAGARCSHDRVTLSQLRAVFQEVEPSSHHLALDRRGALMGAARAAAAAALGPAAAFSQPRSAWAERSFEEFSADKAARQREPGQIKEGETLFTFVERVPLGLDLTEVHISRENGGNRIAVKGIKPVGQAFEMPNLVPGLILQVVQGEPVAGMTADAAIKLVINEKKKRDAEGKSLQLVFSQGTVLQRFEIRQQREAEVAKLKKDIAAAVAADSK